MWSARAARGWRTQLIAGIIAIAMLAVSAALPSPWGRLAGHHSAAAQSTETVEGLAAELDYDLERIFDFVAHEIDFQPYAGVLRGAEGTLAAGAGNSADQALLLARLLDASLLPYRFARASLDGPPARSLLDAALMDRAQAHAAARLAFDGGPYPGVLDLPEPDLAEIPDSAELEAIEAAADRMLEVSGERVTESVALIDAALTDGGVALLQSTLELPELERTAHTWVQVAAGAEWIDLDPAPATLAIGEALTPAAEIFDALPDDERYGVRFAVIAERVRGGVLESTDILEYGGFADEMAHQPITLAHMRPNGLENLGIAIGSLLGEAELSYHPLFVVGGRTIIGDDPIAFGLAANDGGGLLDDSGLFDEPADTSGTYADGETTAEWLEVTITPPDSDARTTRRTIFDRVSPGTRSAGAPGPDDVRPVELVEFTIGAAPDYLPLLGSDSLVVVTGPTSTGTLLERAADAQGIGTLLASSYLAVRDAIGAEHAIDDGAVTFVDRPGVVSFSIDVAMADGEPTMLSAWDIWHRSLGALPARDADLSPGRARLFAGVLEHIAERAAGEAGADETDAIRSMVGVSSLFEAAEKDGIATVVLHGQLPAGLPYGSSASMLIQSALDEGDVVIAPARPVALGGRERMGWWRVDPVSGTTSDAMDDGRAAELVEYSIPWRIAFCVAVLTPAIFAALDKAFDEDLFGYAAAGYTAFWIWHAKDLPYYVAVCRTGLG